MIRNKRISNCDKFIRYIIYSFYCLLDILDVYIIFVYNVYVIVGIKWVWIYCYVENVNL